MQLMNLQREKNFLFVISVTLCYLMLSLIGILHHEIWLDEAHSFLLARDSGTFSELLYNIRLDGHPVLWYLILWVLKKISISVFSMQLLHIAISTLNILLLLFYAPFNKIKKVLLTFSYYFFYEYNIISRNYALCLLCTTLFCILICRENRNYIMIALVLAVMSNTHFLGMLLSFSMGAVALFLLSQDERYRYDKFIWIAVCLILSAAFILCIYQVLPPEETLFSREERPGIFSLRRWSAFSILLKGLFQFPQLSVRFWNTNIFTENKIIGSCLSAALFAIVVKVFADKPLSLFIIISSFLSLSLFLFFMFMHNYTVRHWGFIFMGYYCAVWLAEGMAQQVYYRKLNIHKFLFPAHSNTSSIFLYSVLAVQCFAAGYVYLKDVNHPFSNSRYVADYITAKGYGKDLVIVSNYTSGPAVSAYLGRKLYYPEYHGMGSFGLWNIHPYCISRNAVLDDISSLRAKGYKRAVLALDKNIFAPAVLSPGKMLVKNNSMQIEHMMSFANGIGGNENYELFLVRFK